MAPDVKNADFENPLAPTSPFRHFTYKVEHIGAMPGKETIRTLVLTGFCLILLVWNWHYIIAPSHRAMALLVLCLVFSGVAFYELTIRDVSMEWVLAGIFGVVALTASSWIALYFFGTPLANDHTPLVAARQTGAAGGCGTSANVLQIIMGGTRATGSGNGPFTPLRVGVCPGPTVTRTPRGLMVNGFGYDDDGTVIYRIRDNQFERVIGDYLHIHRPDRSTLAIYDKSENEVLYLRYLYPGTVRMRGHFLCSETPSVTVADGAVTIGSRQLSQPPCTTLKPGPAPDIAHRTL